jgi:hypothetical protein
MRESAIARQRPARHVIQRGSKMVADLPPLTGIVERADRV